MLYFTIAGLGHILVVPASIRKHSLATIIALMSILAAIKSYVQVNNPNVALDTGVSYADRESKVVQ